MKRLTTRNSVGVAVYKHPYECERCGESLYRLPDDGNGSPTDKLAELEDLEEQGWLLRLPCKPNDIVYRINRVGRMPIIKMVVERIELFDNSYALEITDEYGHRLLFLADDVGKTLYITREEAEAKLKEMEESNER